MTQITGADINATLCFVKPLADNGDAQLTILSRAFVVACKICGVDEATALPILSSVSREPTNLVLLDSANHSSQKGSDT